MRNFGRESLAPDMRMEVAPPGGRLTHYPIGDIPGECRLAPRRSPRLIAHAVCATGECEQLLHVGGLR